MPIINPEILNKSKKELFAAILASCDMLQIEKLFYENHSLRLREKMQFKGGQFFVHNNEIAFKIDFMTVAAFSLLLSKMGKFKGFIDPRDQPSLADSEESKLDDIVTDSVEMRMREAEFLESIAASIGTENINDLLNSAFGIEAIGKPTYNQGEIIVFNDHVTYQLVYEVRVIFELVLDQKGNYISTTIKNIAPGPSAKKSKITTSNPSDSELIDKIIETSELF